MAARASGSPSPRRERGPGGEDPLAILRLFGERLAAGDAAGAATLFAPDVEYDEPPAHSFRGRDALRAFIAEFVAAHTNVRFEVVRALASADGATLTAEWRWSYTRAADGMHRAFAGMCLVDLRDGLIASWRGYSARLEG